MLKRAALLLLYITATTLSVFAQLKNIRAQFAHPAPQYKPGVYWYFMDGNMSASSITKDLESMHAAGIGNLIFLEVNVGVPEGNVTFLSDEWMNLFAHAEKEARRLGIEITLGIGPGWTGSGGPWVKPEQSMQHLVASTTRVKHGDKNIMLPIPPPKNPFFGEGGLSTEVKQAWQNYYKDVAVLAFPDKGDVKPSITDLDEKALYYRAPYSSGTVKPFLPEPYQPQGGGTAISKNSIINLTDKLLPSGKLNWIPPAGNWIIMRFVGRNNGAITRPAPTPGLGMEADKLDSAAISYHLEHYVGKLLKKIGKPNAAIPGGLKKLHMDSWEMGAQNWTAGLRQEFIKRRGYDPLPYYPVYCGLTVGSTALSERFLWDLRLTAQEMALDYHARYVKAYAHKHGLLLSIEPYDMTPLADLELGSVADVPMAEFWSKGFGFNATYSVIEATSIGHINGRSLIPAEAFTAQNNEGWKQHPASMKNQGDWAFAAGINRFVYHTFQNQFLPDSLRPGATMGPYGVHWDRSQTWWSMVAAYHQYVTRCQYVLQQGRTVADVLYLTPEGAPQVFVPPASAIAGDTIGDRRGHNFDGCAPGQLMHASVKNGRIVFAGGASYRILVLPQHKTITPQLLQKIIALVKQGATVVGNPPVQAPGLSNYPANDELVKIGAKLLWGDIVPSTGLNSKTFGLGKVIWGTTLTDSLDNLYPKYNLTAGILKNMGIREDMQTAAALRYTHRTGADWDIYFISNTSNQSLTTTVNLRDGKGSPEIWDAVTGEVSPMHNFKKQAGFTTVALTLAPYGSKFIVFSSNNHWQGFLKTPSPPQTLTRLSGPWQVKFDTKWGGPEYITFDSLIDWSISNISGIKYYSGKAIYTQQFNLKQLPQAQIYLDLGDVKNMVRITLNGHDMGIVWTAPWRVNISAAAKKGINELKIEVINLWANRLIGDEQLPYDGIENDRWPDWLINNKPRTSGRYTFTTTRQYSKNSPLQPSGLLGPVTLLIDTDKP